MGKTAFMFPGQGAQFTGMGESFYEAYPCSRDTFEEAEDITGLDLRQMCFHPDERLNQTEYTQIAMYTVEVAILRAVLESGMQSDVNIGLSLGEYSALTASGAMTFADGCKVVRQRGILMEHEVPRGNGGMAAVLGMKADVLEQILQDMNCPLVSVANYNCPGQIVISGEIEQLKQVVARLQEAGARKVVMLNVSGPFHSPMLENAGLKLADTLHEVTYAKIQQPYITNVTAEYVTDTDLITSLLTRQVYSPVRFEQSVRRLMDDGVDTFIEIGPGKTLSSFVRKIAKDRANTERINATGIDSFVVKNVEQVTDLIQ